MDQLRSLSLDSRRANAKLLGLVKKDGSGDDGLYSLGRGSTYLKRFRNATEGKKERFRAEIRANAAAARVKGGKKGAIKSKETIQKRIRKMGMEDDEVMTDRLGGGNLWYACWELFDESDKIAAHQEIRRAELEALSLGRSLGGPLGRAEQAQRDFEMGLGKNAHILYVMGHGELYYSVC